MKTSMSVPNNLFGNRTQAAADLPLAQQLRWHKSARGWRLYAGRKGKRCFGEVVADSKQPGMWRVVLSQGLSDYGNLSWACSAVFEAALREIAWEARQASIPEELEPAFEASRSPARFDGSPAARQPSRTNAPEPPGRTEFDNSSPPQRRRAA
jgi:hypothetical protein